VDRRQDRGTKCLVSTVNTRENIESVQELVFTKKLSQVHIDQCVKSQEKPTNIIMVIKFLFF